MVELARVSRSNVKNEPSSRQSILRCIANSISIPCGASILRYRCDSAQLWRSPDGCVCVLQRILTLLPELIHRRWQYHSIGTRLHVEHYRFSQSSVPARLGKGRGAKEIGHNLVSRERFGHNLVRKRHKIGHTFTRERPKFGLDWWKYGHKSASILQAFLHRLSENTKTAITFCRNKTIFFFFWYILLFGQGTCKSGRAQASTDRAQCPRK